MTTATLGQLRRTNTPPATLVRLHGRHETWQPLAAHALQHDNTVCDVKP